MFRSLLPSWVYVGPEKKSQEVVPEVVVPEVVVSQIMPPENEVLSVTQEITPEEEKELSGDPLVCLEMIPETSDEDKNLEITTETPGEVDTETSEEVKLVEIAQIPEVEVIEAPEKVVETPETPEETMTVETPETPEETMTVEVTETPESLPAIPPMKYLNKLKLDQLKKLCISWSLPDSGNKADLKARLSAVRSQN